MWDLPGPGLEPVSPALAGGFLTTVSPGKSDKFVFKEEKNNVPRVGEVGACLFTEACLL